MGEGKSGWEGTERGSGGCGSRAGSEESTEPAARQLPLSHGLFRPPAFKRMDGYLEGKAQSQERPLNKQKEGPEAFR